MCELPVIETTKALNRQGVSRIETSKLDPFALEGQFLKGWTGLAGKKGLLNHLFALPNAANSKRTSRKKDKKKRCN